MTQAVIIHTIQDAEHYLQQGLYKDAELFSFNVQVVTYLQYQRSIVCHNLCCYMDSEEILNIQKTTVREVGELLSDLDRQLAPALNCELGFSMRYFIPLYSYIGARQLSIYDIVVRCLRRMIEQYSSNTVLVYEGMIGPLNQYIDVMFLNKLLPTVKFRSIRYGLPGEGREKTIISDVLIEQIAPLLERGIISKVETDKKNVVIFEPADKLQFLLQHPQDKTNIYKLNSLKSAYYPIEYKINPRIFPVESSLQSIRVASKDRQGMLVLLYKLLIKDFCRHIIQHLQLVQTYRNIHAQTPIHRAYWETPPSAGAYALVLEYLMNNQVTKVTGIQSRATFFVGQTNSAYADVAVYSRCHQYFTQEAVSDSPVEPKKSGNKIDKRKKIADVAIFLTPTSSFIKTGQNLSNVVAYQEALLSFLDAQYKKEIHVVMSNHPSFNNCAMLSFLKTLTNITLIHDAKLDNYLTKYAPKLILLDSPMPFLEDVVPEELPVILMKDSMFTFNDAALSLLTKRVYYTEGLDETKQLLQKHLNGSLANKMDMAYVQKYCNQERVVNNILQDVNL